MRSNSADNQRCWRVGWNWLNWPAGEREVGERENEGEQIFPISFFFPSFPSLREYSEIVFPLTGGK